MNGQEIERPKKINKWRPKAFIGLVRQGLEQIFRLCGGETYVPMCVEYMIAEHNEQATSNELKQ